MKILAVFLLLMLSKYVSHQEAYYSPKAKALGIQNVPTEQQAIVVKYVAQKYFDPLREQVGSPLYISSYFRNGQLNAAVGGSKYSDHLANNNIAALDIDQDGKPKAKITNRQLFFFIRNNVTFYKLIWEFGTKDNPAWVHVSFSLDPTKNKKMIYRAVRFKNKTVYEVFH